MYKRLLFLSSIFISLLFISCEKESEDPIGIDYSGNIKTLSLTSYGVHTSNFSYQNNRVLDVYRTSIWNEDESTRSSYITSYKHKKLNGFTTVHVSQASYSDDVLEYFLNEDELIDSIIRDAYVPGSFDGKLKHIYRYDIDNHVTTMIKVLYAPGVEDDSTIYVFRTDDSGNIVEVEYTKKTYDGIGLIYTDVRYEFKYDDKRNPFKDFVAAEYFFSFYSEWIHLNRNNIVEVQYYENGIYQGEGHTMDYIYNKYNLPTVIDVSSNHYKYVLEYY